MKDMLTAAIAMAVIIMIQIILSYVFTYQVGEQFSKISWGILFYHYLFKSINKKTAVSTR